MTPYLKYASIRPITRNLKIHCTSVCEERRPQNRQVWLNQILQLITYLFSLGWKSTNNVSCYGNPRYSESEGESRLWMHGIAFLFLHVGKLGASFGIHTGGLKSIPHTYLWLQNIQGNKAKYCHIPMPLPCGVRAYMWEKVWNNLKCLKRCAFQFH